MWVVLSSTFMSDLSVAVGADPLHFLFTAVEVVPVAYDFALVQLAPMS
jgi:hypothetical protein